MSAIAVISVIETAPSRRYEFLPLLMAHRARSLLEEDIRVFQILLPHSQDSKIVLYQVFRDEEALDAHMNGASMVRMRSESGDILLNFVGTRCSPID